MAIVCLLYAGLLCGADSVIADFENDANLRQIAIEALVVEINEDTERKWGIDYTLNRNEAENPGSIIEGINMEFPFKADQVSVPDFIDTKTGNGFVINRTNRLPGLGLSFVGLDIGPGEVSGKLRLLMNQGKAKIRTRPIVVAVNGTTAIIETVEEIPFQDVSFSGKGEAYLDVKYEKVGVKLEVVPTILDLKRRIVELNIKHVTVSAVSSYVTIKQVNRPVFAESTANTSMEMRSGETLIIGGLKTHREVKEENRLPILGSLPLIGWMFKNQTNVIQIKDTLFFITPYILEPEQSPILPFDFVNGIPLTAIHE